LDLAGPIGVRLEVGDLLHDDGGRRVDLDRAPLHAFGHRAPRSSGVGRILPALPGARRIRYRLTKTAVSSPTKSRALSPAVNQVSTFGGMSGRRSPSPKRMVSSNETSHTPTAARAKIVPTPRTSARAPRGGHPRSITAIPTAQT